MVHEEIIALTSERLQTDKTAALINDRAPFEHLVLVHDPLSDVHGGFRDVN